MKLRASIRAVLEALEADASQFDERGRKRAAQSCVQQGLARVTFINETGSMATSSGHVLRRVGLRRVLSLTDKGKLVLRMDREQQ